MRNVSGRRWLQWMRQHPVRAGGVVFGIFFLLVVTNIIDLRPKPVIPPDCPARLALLDNTITEWALAEGKDTLAFPTEKELQRYLHGVQVPRCPEGGTYRFGTLSLATTCSRHGHANVPLPPAPPPPNPLQQVYQFFQNAIGIGAPRQSRGIACIANLKQIDGAIQQWALEHRFKVDSNTVPPVVEVAEFLKGTQYPICPRGGKYFLHAVKDNPECTIIGHSL